MSLHLEPSKCYSTGDGCAECLPDTASPMEFAILAQKHIEYLKTKEDMEENKEEHIVNFDDGSEKEIPISVEEIQQAKHDGMLRNVANDIKLAVDRASRAVKQNDILEAGRELEKINNLADYIIDQV